MKIKFFTIPINAVESFEKEINAFLSTHEVVETEKHLMQSAGQAYWCIYVVYTDSKSYIYNDSSAPKIDYKSILTTPEFERFEKLRIIRKELSKDDAVSAFLIATNEEIAEIAKLENLTLAKLKKIKGFGEKKAEKYGKRIIEKMETL